MLSFFKGTSFRPVLSPDGEGRGGGTAPNALSQAVRDTNRAFTRALQGRIADQGVSIGQWFFLRALWEEDGLTQRELSHRVGMMEPTTVTALNGMERRGLVQRVRNAQDRRKVNIFLTPKGRGLRAVLLARVDDIATAALRDIPPDDLDRALLVLQRATANLAEMSRDMADMADTETAEEQ